MTESEIGIVKHHFDKIGVTAIELTDGQLAAGDTIHIKGHMTDITVKVDSMQIEHDKVAKAVKGDSIGIKVGSKTREHDKVFKVTE